MSSRIPIFKDDLSFEERQGRVWGDMERDMERRRREWEDEIERMRSDFFTLRPEGKIDSLDKLGHGVTDKFDDARSAIEKDQNGQPVFRARFNVQDYKPEEVNVKMDSNKIIVSARHEEKSENKSVSREFNREVNIPKEVDPMALQCTISTDGILTVEAPLPVPQYQAVKDTQMPPPRITHVTPVAASPVSTVRSTSSTMGASSSGPLHTSTYTTFTTGQGTPKPTTTGTGQTPIPSSHSQMPGPSGIHMQPSHINTSFSSPLPPGRDLTGSTGSAAVVENRKFKVEVDIEDFLPEDLTVKTVDKKLVISARKEEKIGNRSSMKELNREFHLPDTVDPVTVKAFFNDAGKLLIEAPYTRPVPVAHFSEGREGSPRLQSGSPITGR